MHRRYHEIIVDQPNLPLASRRVHVVTFSNEDPIERAVQEGLLSRENRPIARCREISKEECFRRWKSTRLASFQN